MVKDIAVRADRLAQRWEDSVVLKSLEDSLGASSDSPQTLSTPSPPPHHHTRSKAPPKVLLPGVPCLVDMGHMCGRDTGFHPNPHNALPSNSKLREEPDERVPYVPKARLTDITRKVMVRSQHRQRRCHVCNPHFAPDKNSRDGRAAGMEDCWAIQGSLQHHHAPAVDMKASTSRETHFGYRMRMRHSQGLTQPPLHDVASKTYSASSYRGPDSRISAVSHGYSSVADLLKSSEALLKRSQAARLQLQCRQRSSSEVAQRGSMRRRRLVRLAGEEEDAPPTVPAAAAAAEETNGGDDEEEELDGEALYVEDM